jgi:hypothetical protein
MAQPMSRLQMHCQSGPRRDGLGNGERPRRSTGPALALREDSKRYMVKNCLLGPIATPKPS